MRWKSIRLQSDCNPIEIGLISRVLPFVQKLHLLLHTFSSFSHYSLIIASFSFYLRLVFAFQSMPKRSSIEVLSKTYRTSIEDLSKTYRISIEDLSKRACVNCFIHLHMVCRLHRIMGKSSCIFLLTNNSSVRSLLRKSGASRMVPYTSSHCSGTKPHVSW